MKTQHTAQIKISEKSILLDLGWTGTFLKHNDCNLNDRLAIIEYVRTCVIGHHVPDDIKVVDSRA